HDARIQPAIVASLHDQQGIACRILVSDKPRLAAAALRAAYPQSLPLAECVVSEALVAADNHAVRRPHGPGLFGQIAGEKLAARAAPIIRAWSRNERNLISLLHRTSGFGVRPAAYSRKKAAKTRSRYSAAKFTACSSMPTTSATEAASIKSCLDEQYSSLSSS